jgi:hypothetical protein
MSNESLFEPEPYEVKKRRKPRTREREQAIKLHAPWVLLRHHSQPPTAHLVVSAADLDPITQRGLRKDGTPRAIPRCQPKKMFPVLTMEGHPLSPVCPRCLEYANKNKIRTEVIERG